MQRSPSCSSESLPPVRVRLVIRNAIVRPSCVRNGQASGPVYFSNRFFPPSAKYVQSRTSKCRASTGTGHSAAACEHVAVLPTCFALACCEEEREDLKGVVCVGRNGVGGMLDGWRREPRRRRRTCTRMDSQRRADQRLVAAA